MSYYTNYHSDTPQEVAVRKFLTKKIRECKSKTPEDTDETWRAFYYEFCKNPWSPVDGFKIRSKEKPLSYGAELAISILNDEGNGCLVECGLMYNRKPTIEIYALVAGHQSDSYSGNITQHHEALKYFLEQIPDIEAAIPGVIMECDKKIKIKELKENSVLTWIAETMKQNGFIYYTEEYETKVKLSVLMPNKLQLNIDIAFSSFHKFIPTLLTVIEQCKAMIVTADAKISITNITDYMKSKESKSK